MLKKLNHLGFALFVFLIAAGGIMLMTGTLHVGNRAPLEAGEGGHEDHGHEAEEAEEAHDDHDDDDHDAHAEAAVADPCCPVEGAPADAEALKALEQKQCEHKVPIIACEECRYEVGVVKLAPSVARSLLTTELTRQESLTPSLALTGQVQADPTRSVELATPGAGRVMAVHKFLGDAVQAGDIIAVVRSAEFAEAKAAWLDAKAQIDLAQRTQEREKGLFAKEISSEADYLDAKKAFQSAEAALAAQEKRLHIFGMDDAQIAAISVRKDNGTFGDLALRASRAGTIITHRLAEGGLVEAGQSLATVADLGRVWIWCDLYERDLEAVHNALERGAGVEAVVTVAAFPKARFAGTLDMVGSALDEHTRTVKARVQVDNAGGRLKAGMFAAVTARLTAGEPALMLPAEAVLHDEGKAFVFQQWKDDLWLKRDVVTGRSQTGRVEIVRGLEPGATVAVSGAFMLKSDVLREKMGAGCAD